MKQNSDMTLQTRHWHKAEKIHNNTT